MQEKKTSGVRLTIEVIIVIVLIIVLINVYKVNNFNDYIRAESKRGVTEFVRDGDVKYSSNMYSYKITNKEYGDAMFYKSIKVKPNTPYKVTCMIKTENVRNQEINADAGAHISINGTVEKSDNVVGTTDWTKVEFLFDSKNRDTVEVGFRLGGFESDTAGTAWFSDMKIESGVADRDNSWNFLCLIFDNTDVNLESNVGIQNVKLSLSYNDVYDIQSSYRRFESSLGQLSNGKITANCEIIELSEPIRRMSYTDENGYFVSGYDVKDVIDPYIKEGKYDHIFISFKTGDMNKNIEIPTNDWIGLGSMEYRNIGFSNIRIPSDEDSYIYKYDSRVNTFPEEVFIHEFLHTLERNAEEFDYRRIELHANEKYGYKTLRLVGLKDWYADYLTCSIRDGNGGYVGLPSAVFNKKPVKYTDFEYSHKLDSFDEPKNLIEEVRAFAYKISSTVTGLFNFGK